MTTAADDRASEDAFEALLAGRPAPGGAAGLAAFTAAVRGAAATPGRPSAALADLLSTGLLTDQSSPSTRTAPTAGTERSRGRTRRRFTVMVPVLVAKFLSAGAVAQAAAGAGVVVVVVTGAGTAGVLPGDAQTAFSDLTGIEQTAEDLGTTEEAVPGEAEELADPSLVEVPGASDERVVDVKPTDVEKPADVEKAADWERRGLDVKTQDDFKVWLAEGTAAGWVTGEAVSAAAHARNDERARVRDGVEETVEIPVDEELLTPTPEEQAPAQDAQVATDDGPGKSGGEGKGKGRD